MIPLSAVIRLLFYGLWHGVPNICSGGPEQGDYCGQHADKTCCDKGRDRWFVYRWVDSTVTYRFFAFLLFVCFGLRDFFESDLKASFFSQLRYFKFCALTHLCLDIPLFTIELSLQTRLETSLILRLAGSLKILIAAEASLTHYSNQKKSLHCLLAPTRAITTAHVSPKDASRTPSLTSRARGSPAPRLRTAKPFRCRSDILEALLSRNPRGRGSRCQEWQG